MKRNLQRSTFTRIAIAILVSFCCVVGANADQISRIGKGAAIVFSPDFADPGNRQFYERLGFLYLESADWREVLHAIKDHNGDPSRFPVRVVIVESHGTNGNGLKLQASKHPDAARSYISVGAIQEHLEVAGVERVILSACNSGRLMRPEIYMAVDRRTVDPLFLPATYGFVDATPGYDPAHSSVQVLRRVESNLETLLHGSTLEMGQETAEALHPEGALQFAVSTMLIQLLIEDDELVLVDGGFVREKSRADLSPRRSEELFQDFCRYISSEVASAPGGRVEPPSPLLAVR